MSEDAEYVALSEKLQGLLLKYPADVRAAKLREFKAVHPEVFGRMQLANTDKKNEVLNIAQFDGSRKYFPESLTPAIDEAAMDYATYRTDVPYGFEQMATMDGAPGMRDRQGQQVFVAPPESEADNARVAESLMHEGTHGLNPEFSERDVRQLSLMRTQMDELGTNGVVAGEYDIQASELDPRGTEGKRVVDAARATGEGYMSDLMSELGL